MADQDDRSGGKDSLVGVRSVHTDNVSNGSCESQTEDLQELSRLSRQQQRQHQQTGGRRPTEKARQQRKQRCRHAHDLQRQPRHQPLVSSGRPSKGADTYSNMLEQNHEASTSNASMTDTTSGSENTIKRILLQGNDLEQRLVEIQLLELALEERKKCVDTSTRKTRLIRALLSREPELLENLTFEFHVMPQHAGRGMTCRTRPLTASRQSTAKSRCQTVPAFNNMSRTKHSCNIENLREFANSNLIVEGMGCSKTPRSSDSKSNCSGAVVQLAHHDDYVVTDTPSPEVLSRKFPLVRFTPSHNQLEPRLLDRCYTRLELALVATSPGCHGHHVSKTQRTEKKFLLQCPGAALHPREERRNHFTLHGTGSRPQTSPAVMDARK